VNQQRIIRLFHACVKLILKTTIRIDRRNWSWALKTGSYIIAANHRTYLDPLLINIALGKPVCWIGARFMQDIPLVKLFSRLAGTFFISTQGRNGIQDLMKMMNLLEDRQQIGIFPEGYLPLIDMKPPVPLRPFLRGFAFAAARLQKPVLPVTIILRREIKTGYPIPVPIRRLFIPHRELCELRSRIVPLHAEIVFHEPVAPPQATASRTELAQFGQTIKNIIEQPLTDHFLKGPAKGRSENGL